MEPEYLKIAREMYGDDLPQRLVDTLNQVDAMCQRSGGNLQSRQVIAGIIHGWLGVTAFPQTEVK